MEPHPPLRGAGTVRSHRATGRAAWSPKARRQRAPRHTPGDCRGCHTNRARLPLRATQCLPMIAARDSAHRCCISTRDIVNGNIHSPPLHAHVRLRDRVRDWIAALSPQSAISRHLGRIAAWLAIAYANSVRTSHATARARLGFPSKRGSHLAGGLMALRVRAGRGLMTLR